ncbi:MAG: hypothetical protein CMN36_06900 [SAR116 cluster bacterium]|nr:hypothetical protein [SAR116 cluster bacterium]
MSPVITSMHEALLPSSRILASRIGAVPTINGGTWCMSTKMGKWRFTAAAFLVCFYGTPPRKNKQLDGNCRLGV